jgi:hypothetical protein
MAVLVEAISVIVKLYAVNAKYPGGWLSFRDAAPNGTLCCDNELARIGFMCPADTKAFVDRLEACGFVYLREGAAQDLVVADQRRGLAASCSWAAFGHIDWNRDPARRVAACRLVGSAEDRLFHPEGWTYEDSLSARHLFVENGRVLEFMDFLRHENGQAVYRDLRTGEEVFVGRTDA